MPVDVSGVLGAYGQLAQVNQANAQRTMQYQQMRANQFGSTMALLGTAAGAGLGSLAGPPGTYGGAIAGASLGAAVGSEFGRASQPFGAPVSAQVLANAGVNAYSVMQQNQQEQAQGALTRGILQPQVNATNTQLGAMGPSPAALSTDPTVGANIAPEDPQVQAQRRQLENRQQVLGMLSDPKMASKLGPQAFGALMKYVTPEIVQTAPGVTTKGVAPIDISSAVAQQAGGGQAPGAGTGTGASGLGTTITQGGKPRVLTADDIDSLNKAGYKLNPQYTWALDAAGMPHAMARSGNANDYYLKQYEGLKKRQIADPTNFPASDEAIMGGYRDLLSTGSSFKDEMGITYTIPKVDMEKFDARLSGEKPANAAGPGIPAPVRTGQVPTKLSPAEEGDLKKYVMIGGALKRMETTVQATGPWRGTDMYQAIRNRIPFLSPDMDIQQFKSDVSAIAPLMHEQVSRVAGYDFNMPKLGDIFPSEKERPEVNMYRMQVQKENLQGYFTAAIENANARHAIVPKSILEGAKAVGLAPETIGAQDHGSAEIKLGTAAAPFHLTDEGYQNLVKNKASFKGKVFEYNGVIIPVD